MNAAREYLTLVDINCEDSWVDSGTGNMAWKPDPVKTKRTPAVSRKETLKLISDNVSLIKTIDSDMLPLVVRKVEQLYMKRIAEEDFIEWCEEECDISEGRAKVIAFDQINKLKTQIRVLSLKKRGYKFALWKHNDHCKVPRKFHETKWDGESGIGKGVPNGLDGYVFKIDNPPIIDPETKVRGYPGQQIGCCCELKGIRIPRK